MTIELFKPTRNGEKEVEVLTRLSTTEATAAVVAQLYLERRSVENLFQTVTENYESEIQTLGYPQAALFSFCLALVTYNSFRRSHHLRSQSKHSHRSGATVTIALVTKH